MRMKDVMMAVVGLVLGVIIGAVLTFVIVKQSPSADVLSEPNADLDGGDKKFDDFMKRCMKAAGFRYPQPGPTDDFQLWIARYTECLDLARPKQ